MAPSLKVPPTLVVYRGFAATNNYVWSPFVTKLEARLRFAGLRYRIEQGSLGKAPRGKIPYVDITYDGSQGPVTMGDSSAITKQLVNDGACDDLNADLPPVGRAHDLAVQALLEDKLYFFQNHERWHENYETMRNKVLAALPYPVQLLVGLLAYRGVTRTLYGQGTGRFSTEELATLRRAVWDNINALLAEARLTAPNVTTPFWLQGGAEPTEADATVFGFIAAGLVCDAAPDTREVIQAYPVLVDYAKRIHDRYFDDYASWEEAKE
ncbi:Failed axon connections-like protein [Colletotrichum aenigma]|uniref:Failed axon connections-like protein n=1 Tax=Colletotrichum aenigma TaxID=1215731 RepID=UPI001872D89F|nr:Failed axon connections-like protein [Colletotrichum aenigma]KAF5507756.1 Failed axon connections-like protein [Colletotrichum aenigma]